MSSIQALSTTSASRSPNRRGQRQPSPIIISVLVYQPAFSRVNEQTRTKLELNKTRARLHQPAEELERSPIAPPARAARHAVSVLAAMVGWNVRLMAVGALSPVSRLLYMATAMSANTSAIATSELRREHGPGRDGRT
jgi:hypothetical protein